MRPYVNITFGNQLQTEILEALKQNTKALNLLLRLGKSNMQAIDDFTAAQKAFQERITPAIAKIEANQGAMMALIEELKSGTGFSDADQQKLNELHALQESNTAELERIASVVTPVP